jgi:RNA polymerase sigma-70 factor (ECF subfamily)
MKVGTAPGDEVDVAPAAASPRMGAADLFRAHAGFVAGFLSRMGAAAVDLDDLTQEVFLVAHRRGGYEPGPARPTTWLAEIALRVLATYRRSKRRKPSSNGMELDALEGHDAGPDEVVAARRSLSRVQACLEGLDEQHRAVFVLFELEGEPCASIAAALDLPVGTVYSRLHNARKKFLDAWGSTVEQ